MFAWLKNLTFFHPPDGESDRYRYTTSLERGVKRIFTPLDGFIRSQMTSSVLLFLCAILALLIVNSNFAPYYETFIHYPLSIIIGKHELTMTVQKFVNDGLLVLFFFVLGLEIKRAMLVGELADPRRAILVILAAIGGMIVPALIYYFFNQGLPSVHGWGIPVATDTAFALGVLLLLGTRIPRTVITFLVALAIVDDIGAVIIIAVFYSVNLAHEYLYFAGALVVFLTVLNAAGLRRPFIYILTGIVIWWAIEMSGLHASIAGVMVAFTIPARPEKGPRTFIEQVKKLLGDFEAKHEERLVLADELQHDLLAKMSEYATHATTPLQRWGNALERPVALLVLPLFALVNAGVLITPEVISSLVHDPVSVGVFVGLLAGKFIGVSAMTYFCLRSGWGKLPDNMNMQHIIGVSLLCGMGFTMSVFIAGLSFEDPNSIELVSAKITVMLASVIAGVLGFIWLRYFTATETETLKNNTLQMVN